MKAMMEQFEKLGEKEDFDLIVEQMMKQLLGKDVMYEPMKQVTEKFPEWLADNESELSKEDYERYGRMYQYFQKIVAVYESEPNNFERLQELMQDMQECGQVSALWGTYSSLHSLLTRSFCSFVGSFNLRSRSRRPS